MKTIVFCILCVLIFPALLFTQGKQSLFGIGLEIQAGYGIVSEDAFVDYRPPHTAGDWLNEITRGFLLLPRINVYVPFGIRLYGGYHYSSFPEQDANNDLWTSIFNQNMRNRFEKESHSISNTSRGFIAGIAYSPSFLRSIIQPYIFWELRSERLKSTTRLEGFAIDFPSLTLPATGDMKGRTYMKTERVLGTAYGFGLEIEWGRFVFAPEWRYVSVTAPIIERIRQWNIFRIEGIGFSGWTFWPDIRDEQKIEINYHSLHLGLRYNISASEFSAQMFIPEEAGKIFAIGAELQTGYGAAVGDSYSDRRRTSRDPEDKPMGLGDWLNEINGGNLFSAKIITFVPYGFRLYGGYHYGSYPERNPNAWYWTMIYFRNFRYDVQVQDYAITNTGRGGFGGIAYAPPFLEYSIRPYIFWELRSERFRSSTEVTAKAEDVYITPYGYLTGDFKGNSILRTKRVTGMAYGLGFEIPWGRIAIVPEWRYHSAKSPVDRRKYEITVLQEDGSVVHYVNDLEMFIADGKWKIDMRHHAINIGIRYLIFR